MFQTLTSQPFNILWRSALVRLPRAVPTQILYWTDPQGPYPIVVNLPSRGSHLIPIYVFVDPDIASGNLPVIIDFHGGGFFLGSCLEQAPFCSRMARSLGAVVLSVDYRMGPVSKFPAAVEDAEDVLRAVLEPSTPAGTELRKALQKHINECHAARTKDNAAKVQRRSSPSPRPAVHLDTSRISISGFSSGGNLALNLAISLNHPDTEWPSVFEASHQHLIPLLLFYPSFDARQLPSERTLPATIPTGSTFWTEVADLLAPTYLPRDQAAHPRASPGLASVCGLHPMARMMLVLPGIDSLLEQSETWIQKIEEGGRAPHLRLERYPEMKHGWTQMPDSWLGEAERATKVEIFDKSVMFVKKIWAGDENVLTGVD